MNKKSKNVGGDIEAGYTYVITIAIIVHGCITTTVINNNYNIQFHSATHNEIKGYTSSRNDDYHLRDRFNNTFRQSKPSISDTHPPHFNNLPYDKILGNYYNQGCVNRFFNMFNLTTNGIWLISVHRKPSESTDNDYEYVYPTDTERYINLLNIEGFKDLSYFFNFNSEFSQIFQELINFDKIKLWHGDKNWKVELNHDHTRIEYIRLTYLLDLLKKLFGLNCHLNVFDYSCSSMCREDDEINSSIQSLELSDSPYFKAGRFIKSKKRRYLPAPNVLFKNKTKKYSKNKRNKRKSNKRKSNKRKYKKR
jgi:hypothetical protein